MITREEAKELLPIMQAFVEGKQIQDKIDDLTDWVDTNGIILEFNGKKIQHRIKPESEYRPFKNKEECWNEMLKHKPFGWIKNKNNGTYSDISTMYRSCGEERLMIANSSYNLSQALEVFTFTDGTPFGIFNK